MHNIYPCLYRLAGYSGYWCWLEPRYPELSSSQRSDLYNKQYSTLSLIKRAIFYIRAGTRFQASVMPPFKGKHLYFSSFSLHSFFSLSIFLSLFLSSLFLFYQGNIFFTYSTSVQVWPAVREHAAKTAVIVMAVILSLHFLLATGFMLYFFHASVSFTLFLF